MGEITMRKLKRRKTKTKKIKYDWPERITKITDESQVKVRQLIGHDRFEVSITNNGYQWST